MTVFTIKTGKLKRKDIKIDWHFLHKQTYCRFFLKRVSENISLWKSKIHLRDVYNKLLVRITFNELYAAEK